MNVRMQQQSWPSKAERRFIYAFYFALALVLFAVPLIAPDDAYACWWILALLPLMCWAITGLYLVAFFVVSLRRKAWRTAAIAALLPVLPAIMLPGWNTTYRHIADWEHFIVRRPYYDSQVARLPDSGARFAEFNWGGMSFASYGVVYDETDEIARGGRQSPRWIARLKNTDLLCGEDKFTAPVQHLGGHYYAVGFGC